MKISAFVATSADPVSRLKSTPSRHRFEKPIHNVKKLALPWESRTAAVAADLVSSSLDNAKALVAFGERALRVSTKAGGAYRDRTDDLMLAKQPLSQLS